MVFVLRSSVDRRDRSRDLAAVLESLDLAGEVPLPFTLENDRLRLQFEADTERGVLLTAITQLDGSAEFSWETRPPAALDADYGGLWAVHGLRRRSRVESAVTPRDAAEFRAFTARGTEDLVLLWQGIHPAGKAGDRLWLVLRVSLAPEDSVSRWHVWVGREHGDGFSIDEIDLPRLWVRGPVAPQPFESHLLAQRRARLLVPTALVPVRPFWAANDSFYLWAAVNVARREVHPGAGQLFQFSTLYAADPGDAGSYRRMLYLGSEDENAVHKTFEHEGVTVSGPDGDEAWYGYRHTFFPPFGDLLAGAEDTPASEFGNTYAPQYPAVVGALTAQSDAFWYDACAFYRAFVERSGIGGPKLADNTLLTKLKGPAIRGFYIFEPALLQAAPSVYLAMLERTIAFQKALENPYQPNTAAYMHLQNWFDGGHGVNFNPPRPIEAHIDPGVVNLLREANARGVRVSGYTLPEIVDPSWFELFPIEATHWTREGVRRGEDPEHQRIPDFRNPEGNGWYAEFVYPEMMKLGFGGVYADVISGPPSTLTYDPPPPFEPAHLAHGGSWVTGVREFFLKTRRAIREASILGPAGEPDVEAFVTSEVVEEGIIGVIDYVQDGYIWLPHHMLLAEEAGIPLGVTEVPDQARDPAPPLWSAVYHEYQPVGRLGIPQSNVALGTNPRFYPDEEGFTGMTPEEFVDYYRLFPAATWSAGYRLVFTDQLQFESPIVVLEDGELTVDRSADPAGAGLQVMQLVRALFAASARGFAGRFVVEGRMERPLQVDYGDEANTRVFNPVFATRKTNPKNFLGVFAPTYLPFNPDVPQFLGSWGTFAFDVPAVFQAMWRSQEGELGLVLVNWTRRRAGFAGTFDPTLYGFGERETWVANELLQGREPRPLGAHSGTVVVRADDAPVVLGGDVWLGTMRPASVRVVVFSAA